MNGPGDGHAPSPWKPARLGRRHRYRQHRRRLEEVLRSRRVSRPITCEYYDGDDGQRSGVLMMGRFLTGYPLGYRLMGKPGLGGYWGGE